APSPGPPHHPLEPRRHHRPRQPGHPLLVSPPHRSPPTRTQPHPRPQHQTMDPHQTRPIPTPVGTATPPRRQFRCSASLRPPQEPSLGRASTAPVVELRRNSIPENPEISRAFAVFPSGSVTTVPAVT